MHKEAEVAAQWWANILNERNIHDNGEVIGSGLANYGLSRLNPLSANVIENFEKALIERLDQEIAKSRTSGDWQDDKPNLCSYFRAGWLNIDYHVHGILKDVATGCGIPESELDLRFPIKTIMWINPNEVSVQHGYGAEIEKLL